MRFTNPRILIVGGYGTFGGRLVDLISDIEGLTVLVAGRSSAKATVFCARKSDVKARLVPISFDREGDLAGALDNHKPHIVVDASGPFQDFGEDPYLLIKACIDAGISYMDLADGADFVEGVPAFDFAAKHAGVFVLSGVSSFPVLTAAVVRRLAKGMASVETVVGGIAPSPYAGVGPNVIRAVLGYAGRPVRTGIVDSPVQRGLTGEHFVTIAPPGKLPLNPTLFSVVDVPDLRAIPALWPNLKSIWMGAGPVPETLHRILILLARLVGRGWLPPISALAPVAHAAINMLRWGEDRGGMFVRVGGDDAEGRPVHRTWHMVADGTDGPMIPSMAVEALIRRWLDDSTTITKGARNAASELELSDYETMFARRKIVHGIRHDVEPLVDTVHGRILDRAFADLPQSLRDAHGQTSGASLNGLADIEQGRGTLARLIAWAVGFPATGKNVPVRVRFDVDGPREIWTRHFAGQPMTSTQEVGSGRFEGLLVERFGSAAFGLALLTGNDRLILILRRWTMFGISMPLSWAPRSNVYEDGDNDRFNFHVEVSHPLTGPIVKYVGWLRRDQGSA